MKRIICLPDEKAVTSFVNAAGEQNTAVLVSPMDFNVYYDGGSILGMMSMMARQISVDVSNASEKLLGIVDQYAAD